MFSLRLGLFSPVGQCLFQIAGGGIIVIVLFEILGTAVVSAPVAHTHEKKMAEGSVPRTAPVKQSARIMMT